MSIQEYIEEHALGKKVEDVINAAVKAKAPGDDTRHRLDARESPLVPRRAPSITHPPRAAAMEMVRARLDVARRAV